MIECAVFLRDPKIRMKKTWSNFSKQFLDEYQTIILSFFGFSPEVLTVPRIRLNDRKLFLAITSALAHQDLFASDRKEVAQVLYDRFELGLEYSSILQYICENNSEYEDVLSFLTNTRKV